MLDAAIHLIEVLAWPATVLIIFFASRKEIFAILPKLKRLKAGPVSAEFEMKVELVKKSHLPSLPNFATSPKAEERFKTLSLIAHLSPKTAILGAWEGIETSLKKAVLKIFGGDSPLPSTASTIKNIEVLSTEGKLSQEDVALLHDLRGLRNQAAHLPEYSPTVDAAHDYLRLAVLMEEKLNVFSEIGA